ncbi:hypothetical protein AALF85_05560 [Jeotgalicoccus halotolerans]|uniref:hypothetical protein n=1 Tax=Jeotgalicoccus halotolerans TaxID=157227 RepID=UPI003511E896
MAKLFNIVLFILGISSLINGFSHLPSNILLASVNLIAAVILLYVSIKMLKAGKEVDSDKSSKTK